MKLMHSEWQDRVKHWIRTLQDDLYEPLGEISWEAFQTMDYLTLEEALKGSFAPVAPGFTWGREWEYCWFKGSVTLPERAKGERIVLDLKPDGESAIFVNGKSVGTYRASWVDAPHHFMEDNALSFCAQGGEKRAEIASLYERENWPDYAVKVHALKSTSLTIGAEKLSAQAKTLRSPIKRRWFAAASS